MRKEHRLHRLEGEAFKEGGHVMPEIHIHLEHGGMPKKENHPKEHHHESHRSVSKAPAHQDKREAPLERSEHFKKHASAFAPPHETMGQADGISKKVNTPAEKLVTGSPDAVRVKRGGPIEAAEGQWIQGAIKHPGALHRELGIPQDRKIPSKTLHRAENSSNPMLAKRAHLADTMRHFRPRSR